MLSTPIFVDVYCPSIVSTPFCASVTNLPQCELRYIEGVVPYCFLKSFIKCEVLGNVHSLPISEIDFDVEINNRRDCISRWWINHLWGGVIKWRLNSFLNDVSERLHFEASISMEMSLKMLE